MNRARYWLVALSGIALASGCVKRLGDVDQTQPHAIRKADLEGDWYYREMVTDIQRLASEDTDAIIGYPTDLVRVRWEINRGELIAVALDELLPGTNGNGEDLGSDLEERILARYPIESHFTIRRGFDPLSGEESNVIMEDGQNGEWFDRPYMRVTWSNNTATNWLIDTFKPDGQQFIQADEDEDTDAILEILPESINFTTQYVTNVVDQLSGRIDVRTSFLKVDPENDYETSYYKTRIPQKDLQGNTITDPETGLPVYIEQFERYGFFRTERNFNDRWDGQRLSNTVQMQNRFNIWKKSKNANGELIPVQQRDVKPILYFMAEDYPEEMIPAAYRIGELWNDAFVEGLKNINHKDSNKNNLVAFAVCENPVTSGSSEVCRTAGEGTKYFGDLRYNFLKLARPAGTINPLGFGPSSADYRTGETVNGWAVTYYAGLTTYSKYVVDMVKLYQGIVDPDSVDWLDGSYWDATIGTFAAEGAGQGQTAFTQNNAHLSTISPEARDLAKNSWMKHVHGAEPFEVNGLELNLPEQIEVLANSMAGKSVMETALRSSGSLGLSDIVSPMEGEANLADLFGGRIDTPSSMSLAQAIRVHNEVGARPLTFREQAMKQHVFSENCLMTAEYANPTIAAMAERLSQKYQYPVAGEPNFEARFTEVEESLLKEIRDAFYISVQLHEVGHNLGLRHNFGGSMDENNYIDPVSLPEWSSDVNPGSKGSETPEGYWAIARQPDPEGALVDKRLQFQYSSIMDYDADAMFMSGLGPYDIGAIRFGYMGHIEAFKGGDHPNLAADRAFNQNSSLPTAQLEAVIRDKKYEVISKERVYIPWETAKIELRSPATDSSLGYSEYDDVGGHFLEKVYAAEDANGDRVNGLYVNRHHFCTDTFADGLVENCYRWDVGRDPAEVIDLYGRRLREQYTMMNFRRGSIYGQGGFNMNLVSSVFQRYYWYTALRGLLAEYVNVINDIDSDEAIQAGVPYHVNAALGLNDIMTTIMTPDTGTYGWSASDPNLLVQGGSFAGVLGESPYAHEVFTTFADNEVEQWRTPARYGYYNNKIGALLPVLIGFNANLEDWTGGQVVAGAGNISMANAFPAETAELMKSMFIGQPSRYSALPVTTSSVGAALGNPSAVAAPGSTNVQNVIPSNRLLADILEAKNGTADAFHTTLEADYGDWDSVPKAYAYHSGFEFQYGLMYSMGYLANFQDRQWSRYLTMHQKGDVYDRDYSIPVAEFADPGTGIIWRAPRYPTVKSINGRDVDPSVAAAFLDSMNDTVAEIELNDGLEAAMDYLDAVRWKLDWWYTLHENYNVNR